MKPRPLTKKDIHEYGELLCPSDDELIFKHSVLFAVEWLKERLGGECDEEVDEAFNIK